MAITSRGFQFLILGAQFSRRSRDLRIFGPTGVSERITAAIEVLFPGSTKVDRRFQTTFTEFTDRHTVRVDPFAVTPYEVVHASGATPFALRVAANGKIIAYSGDTQWTDSLQEVARDADVFVCEAYTFGKVIRYHLDFGTLMAHRGDLHCKRLILTHMSEDMLSHLRELDVESAADGMTIML